MEKLIRIKRLIKQLNEYRDSYYNEARPVVSDAAYDKLFDELSELEKETGVVYANSPTQTVGYVVKSELEKVKHSHPMFAAYDKLFDELSELEKETGVVYANSPTQTVGYVVKSELEKVKHSHPMLSLDKTKSVDDLVKFAGEKDCILSLKMDGLTCLLTYENGELVQGETRGDGEVGELITHNAKVFDNIPLTIDYKGHFEIEGEAIITYDDFNKINEFLSDDKKYKNPRNLASGSVRQLDSKIASQRHIKFIAWKVPTEVPEGICSNSFLHRLMCARDFGFEIISFLAYSSSDKEHLPEMIESLKTKAHNYGYPIDGLVMTYNDIQYGESLGMTAYSSSDKEHLPEMIESLKTKAHNYGYPIDGLVMTYNDIQYGESLGMTGHHPKHSIAFKFYDEEVETVLKNIEWSMGKIGSLTPVAIFDPVEIDGTMVERASLSNISILEKTLGKKPYVGQIIVVSKRNMIIPKIERAKDENGVWIQ